MDDKRDFWVFAYGSLMWRPGFTCAEKRPALLEGYHRSFCIYSAHYRGTPEAPGLVLGLDQGGSCRGIAYRVDPALEAPVRAYLDERESLSYAYKPKTVTIEIDDSEVEAHTYVADPTHPQYAGDLGIDWSAQIICDAAGCAGLNRDYLINTVRELEAHGYSDERLHELLKRVEYLAGLLEAGGGI
jgi:cation transport protein ChaC